MSIPPTLVRFGKQASVRRMTGYGTGQGVAPADLSAIGPQMLKARLSAFDPGCSLIPGLGQALPQHPRRVQGSLRGSAFLHAFDVLELDGRDLRNESLGASLSLGALPRVDQDQEPGASGDRARHADRLE